MYFSSHIPKYWHYGQESYWPRYHLYKLTLFSQNLSTDYINNWSFPHPFGLTIDHFLVYLSWTYILIHPHALPLIRHETRRLITFIGCMCMLYFPKKKKPTVDSCISPRFDRTFTENIQTSFVLKQINIRRSVWLNQVINRFVKFHEI